MTLTITLDPEQESALRSEAARHGVPPEEYAGKLIAAHLPDAQGVALAALIQSWIDGGDEAEQWETMQALREGLSESHSSARKLFQ